METNEEVKGKETQESEAEISTTESTLQKDTESRGADTTLSPIEEAKEVASRIEKANAETKKLLDRQERIVADQIVAGKGFAGSGNRGPTEKDKAIEFWGEDSLIGNAIKKHGE